MLLTSGHVAGSSPDDGIHNGYYQRPAAGMDAAGPDLIIPLYVNQPFVTGRCTEQGQEPLCIRSVVLVFVSVAVAAGCVA